MKMIGWSYFIKKKGHAMAYVQIFVEKDIAVLKEGPSELLILPEHLKELRSFDELRKFENYFLERAMVNRAARKLFKAWLRRDPHLLERFQNKIK